MAWTFPVRKEQQEFGVRAPVDKGFRIVLEAVQSLKWKVERRDDVLLFVRVRTGFGVLSAPQSFELQVKKVNKETSKVVMIYSSRLATYDAGYFQKNARRFGETIAKLAPAMDRSGLL